MVCAGRREWRACVFLNHLRVSSEERQASDFGLGSIATKPTLRKQGFAGRLIWDVMRLFHNRADIFYLYADIAPDYYGHFDFVALPECFQGKSGSVAMIRCQKEKREALLSAPDYQPPDYF